VGRLSLPHTVCSAQYIEYTVFEGVAVADDGTEDVVVEDLLVEEVSIDGMCGVY
jgi:mycofactocin precursor